MYSTPPPPIPEYRGHKKPTVQNLLAEKISEWFLKYTGESKLKLSFDTATEYLAVADPSQKLAKYQSHSKTTIRKQNE